MSGVVNEETEEKVEESKQTRNKRKQRNLGRKLLRFQRFSDNDSIVSNDSSAKGSETTPGGDSGPSETMESINKSSSSQILLIETENITHEPFEQTQEIKVAITYMTIIVL